jgi:hypothetical protein
VMRHQASQSARRPGRGQDPRAVQRMKARCWFASPSSHLTYSGEGSNVAGRVRPQT